MTSEGEAKFWKEFGPRRDPMLKRLQKAAGVGNPKPMSLGQTDSARYQSGRRPLGYVAALTPCPALDPVDQIDQLLAQPERILERQHNGFMRGKPTTQSHVRERDMACELPFETDADLSVERVVEDFDRCGLDGVCHRQNSLNLVGASRCGEP